MSCHIMSCTDPECSIRVGPDDALLLCFGVCFFSYQPISQTAVQTSLYKQLDTMGPSATRGGPYQYF